VGFDPEIHIDRDGKVLLDSLCSWWFASLHFLGLHWFFDFFANSNCLRDVMLEEVNCVWVLLDECLWIPIIECIHELITFWLVWITCKSTLIILKHLYYLLLLLLPFLLLSLFHKAFRHKWLANWWCNETWLILWLLLKATVMLILSSWVKCISLGIRIILYETSSWHLELILGLLLELIGLLGLGSSCLTKEGLGCDTIIDVLGFKFIWVLLTFL